MSAIELDEIRERDWLDHADDLPPAGVYADRRKLIRMVDDQATTIAALRVGMDAANRRARELESTVDALRAGLIELQSELESSLLGLRQCIDRSKGRGDES